MGPTTTHEPVRLFISYSHKDERFREQLQEHLHALKRRDLIDDWHDRKIAPGREWEGIISENLEASEIILLLISSSFIASPYCYETEMVRALEKHQLGEARVIPVILRPVDWSDAPFARLQALPKDGRPVSRWSNRDEAWVDVAQGIRQALEELSSDHLPQAREPEREVMSDTKEALLKRQEQAAAAGGFAPTPSTRPGSILPEEPAAIGKHSKHNLPAPRSSFVGRERELEEFKGALAMTRLLTLTGAGGSGKTRFALEVARDLVEGYPDGVWLAEFAPLSEAQLVPQAVAEALGVREQPGRSLMEALVDFLREKTMVLILDNCEHLIDAAARLADTLLDACPHLRVLATSREALDVEGETIWRVPTLSVPHTDRLPTAGELTRYAAVRLFVDRARQRDPAFTLATHNAKAVAQICRRLDGIPLPMELAAARVGALSVEQIAERLEDSLGFLRRGGRTVPPRQRTIRGALDWSYELLGESEQVLFRWLSVFAGGFTLEAAEAVAPGESIAEEEGDVSELLSSLVEKSLVVAEENVEGGLRYRMLEPVRQYALDKLEESSDAEAVRRRHAEFFFALEEEAGPSMLYGGSEQAAWLRRLDAEHDNIRAALSWSLEGGDPGLGLGLAEMVYWFWEERGHYSEGRRWLEEALLKGGGAAPTAARAGALSGLGVMLRLQGELERAEAYHKEALALYKELGNQERAAIGRIALGWMALLRGDPARATTLFEETLAAIRESEDRRLMPRILSGLALIAADGGDFERARQLWGEALALARQVQDSVHEAATLFDMGYVELALGNRKRASALLEEVLVISRELGTKSLTSACLLGLGIAATLSGAPKQAKALLKESLAMEVEWGNKADITENLEGLAEAAGALDQHLQAARLWGAAAALRERVGIPWRPTERLLHEPQLVAACSRLDEAVWEMAFAEGKAMGIEEAVKYALSEEEPAAFTSPAPDSG